MTSVQSLWKEQWESWKCYTTTINHRDDEDEEQYRKRREDIVREITETGRLKADTVAGVTTSPWDGGNTREFQENSSDTNRRGPDVGLAVTRMINAERVEKDRRAQGLISQIFVHVLSRLCLIGEIALANSIWFSIRTDAVPIVQSNDGKGRS
jgi:hypothetical protein